MRRASWSSGCAVRRPAAFPRGRDPRPEGRTLRTPHGRTSSRSSRRRRAYVRRRPRDRAAPRSRAVAGADEDVLGPRRAVDEVPLLQGAFLAFDQNQALAAEDEEVLLRVLRVVHAVRLPRVEDLDVDPEVAEPGLALEDNR